MASFVSLSGSIVMKSGVKFGRVGILSERKFSLISIHTLGEKRNPGNSKCFSKAFRKQRDTEHSRAEGRAGQGMGRPAGGADVHSICAGTR